MRRCNGELHAEQLRRIEDDHTNGRLELGNCSRCARTNIPARNEGGVWKLDSHEPMHHYRSGKHTGEKRQVGVGEIVIDVEFLILNDLPESP